MSTHRKGLTLQGTSWSPRSEERLRREADTSDEAYNELRRREHRQGKLCKARAVIATISRESDLSGKWSVWRLPPNNDVWNPPKASDWEETEYELDVYEKTRAGNLMGQGGTDLVVGGVVVDENGCVYGYRHMSPQSRAGPWKGDVKIGGKWYHARSDWQYFKDSEDELVSIQVLRIQSPRKNIFAP